MVTDTAGYIIGRTVGGPKFSSYKPEKTWSGVLAGWLAAGLFAWHFVGNVAPNNLFQPCIYKYFVVCCPNRRYDTKSFKKNE